MADFNVNLAAPQAAGARVVAPVQEAGFGDVLRSGANLLGSLMEGKAKADKENAAAQKEAILNEYSSRYRSIAEDVKTSNLMPGQREAMTRSLFNQYVANYAGLSDEFKKITAGFREFGTISDEVERAQMFKDQKKKDIAAAAASGVEFSPYDSDNTTNMKLTSWRAQVVEDEKFKRKREQFELNKSMSAEERAVWEHNNKVEADTLINKIGVDHYESTLSSISDIQQAVASGRMSVEEAKLEIERKFGNISTAIATVSHGNTSYAAPWDRAFGDLKSYALNAINPETSANALEQQKKSILAMRQIQILTTNPELKEAAALSGLFGPGTLGLMPQISTTILENVRKAGEGKDTAVLGSPEEKPSLALITKNLQDLRANTSTSPDVTAKGVQKFSEAILNEVGNKINKPNASYKDLLEVANFFAQPEWAYAVEKGLVSKEANQKAKEAFQTIYSKSISNAVLEKVNTQFKFSASGASKPLMSVLDLQFSGSGVSLGVASGYMSPIDKQDAVRYQRELKPTIDSINKLIHIGAHMEGTTDYAKYWENNKHNILPGVYYQKGSVQTVGGKKYEYIGPYPTSDQRSWREIVNKE